MSINDARDLGTKYRMDNKHLFQSVKLHKTLKRISADQRGVKAGGMYKSFVFLFFLFFSKKKNDVVVVSVVAAISL